MRGEGCTFHRMSPDVEYLTIYPHAHTYDRECAYTWISIYMRVCAYVYMPKCGSVGVHEGLCFHGVSVYVVVCVWLCRYRRINPANAAFHSRVGSLEGGLDFLTHCGFVREEGSGGGGLLVAPPELDMSAVDAAIAELSVQLLYL